MFGVDCHRPAADIYNTILLNTLVPVPPQQITIVAVVILWGGNRGITVGVEVGRVQIPGYARDVGGGDFSTLERNPVDVLEERVSPDLPEASVP